MRVLFIRWLLPHAFDWIIQNVICYWEVSRKRLQFVCCPSYFGMSFFIINVICLFLSCFSYPFAPCSVCLRNLQDHGNAFLAFERSVMLPDAVKYPLIYLNFAIYCVQMRRYEMAALYLANFFSVSEHTAVRHEVSCMLHEIAGRQFLHMFFDPILSILV